MSAIEDLRAALAQTDRVWANTSRHDRNVSALGEAARAVIAEYGHAGRLEDARRAAEELVRGKDARRAARRRSAGAVSETDYSHPHYFWKPGEGVDFHVGHFAPCDSPTPEP